MTFEELQDANEILASTDIKGKDYIMVNQRIKAFRMLFPNGAIETEIVSLDDGIAVMKATAKDETGAVLGVGHAYEKEDDNFINKTSYIENCETSAVGRALGMVGIGIDTSVASAEEMQNALEQQKKNEELASEAQKSTIRDICKKHKIDAGKWIENCGYNWDTLPASGAGTMLATLKERYG